MAEERLLDADETFSSMSNIVDSRILRALADMGFARPTLVQSKAIPLALEGRDILGRARTGSGKTAAYCISIVQKILNVKSSSSPGSSGGAVRALILVPTRELSDQVAKHLRDLLAYCETEVSFANVASSSASHLERTLASDKPDIVIATPSRALNLLRSKSLSLSSLESLVVDEADLVLSYGHDEDMQQIFNGGYLPKVYQSFLMSATFTKDVEQLKGMVLRNPAILKLEEDEDEAANLTQYAVRCGETDKFLLTYVILKLKLVQGKCIIFVNDVDRCYRVKLFLEQFSIKSCVLNSELPLNSRVHIVQEFNKGVYDYIIATDESSGRMEADEDEEDDAEGEEEASKEIPDLTPSQREPAEETPSGAVDANEDAEGDDDSPSSSSKPKKRKRAPSPPPPPSKKKAQKRSKKGGAAEYGVVRGVDFIDVACVLNFDLPTSTRTYTHRVGRTARAGRTGMALSFIVPKEEWGKNKVVGCLESAKKDEKVFARIERQEAARGAKVKEYKFDMAQVEAFRYRMQDALRSVTRSAIKEARVKELKAEILASEKLKAHFEDNPLDLEYLRHDKPLHPSRVQPHMKNVPKYLMPRIAAAATPVGAPAQESEGAGTFVPFKKTAMRGRGRGRGGRGGGGASRGGRKKADPLKKFGR